MPKQVISTDKAPAAVGAYSQGIIANGFVFTAGQVPLVPGSSNLAEGGIEGANASGNEQYQRRAGSQRQQHGQCGEDHRFPGGY